MNTDSPIFVSASKVNVKFKFILFTFIENYFDEKLKIDFLFLDWIHIYYMIALKLDTSGRDMVPTMENSKQKIPLDHFSTKYHFNPPYIDRDMVNGMDGVNI